MYMTLLLEGRAQGKCDCYYCHFEGTLHGSQSILKYFPDLVSKMSELSECAQQLKAILKSEKNISGIYAFLILR